MAVNGAQYIFGEFSPDEFNQFFVTPRCSVELPPYNETVSCGIKSTGEEYQRIEFGVNEVIETESSVLNNTDYSISSTLNPQAPEFILSCAPAQKTPDETNYNSIDCQFSDPTLTLDSGSNAENDGLSGGLGQRERKKKKKKTPWILQLFGRCQ